MGQKGEKLFGLARFYAYSGVMFIKVTRIATGMILLGLWLAGAPAVAGEAKEAVSPVAKAMSGLIATQPSEPTDPADNQAAGILLVPRFVTLATDEVNMRTGPGTRYPIRLVIKRGGMPVEVVSDHEAWRKIRIIDGDEGWVHKAMLSGRRAVIIQKQVQTLLKKPAEGAPPVAKLEPGVIAQLEACIPDWCNLHVASYEGWIKKNVIWGVYPHEKFKE